jgi:hypothetical protein
LGKRAQSEDGFNAGVPKKRVMPGWVGAGILAACVLAFFWIPLTSDNASIQWDAADLHYPFQKYLSDHITAGNVPSWTPYISAGYPFLAYPEVGTYYTPHWPLFLLGITPRSIQVEIALASLLACLGAFLLIGTFVENRTSAILGGLAYGLSGFFSAHAEHVGMIVSASCFPWLLLAYRRALQSSPVRNAALGGIAGAHMLFAGYAQTAMYGLLALGLFAIADVVRERRRWAVPVLAVAGILILTLMVAAIELLPAVEFTNASTRSGADFSALRSSLLDLRALMTLIAPNWLGTITHQYSGPTDITQYYYYAGVILLPLAALGLATSKVRWHALLLIVPTAWFMLGPGAGLYRLAMFIPGMKKVRAPIQGWFVVALGLAILAAAGLDWVTRRWRFRFLGVGLVAILFADLWYWNSWSNPLAYARDTWETRYGAGAERVKLRIAPQVPALTRLDAGTVTRDSHLADQLFDAADWGGPPLTIPGPRDQALDLKMETTYSYAALQLAGYTGYRSAMVRNPKLRDGLTVSLFVTENPTAMLANPTMLPRAYFPKSMKDVRSDDEARLALETLDPSLESVVLVPHDAISQDASAVATMVASDETSYRIHYRASSPSLLRLSVPFYTGWRVFVEGKAVPIVKVDFALMGVVVPAGEREVVFDFRSNTLKIGAVISGLGLLLAVFLAVRPPDPRKTS